jgi:hypothetical protein
MNNLQALFAIGAFTATAAVAGGYFELWLHPGEYSSRRASRPVPRTTTEDAKPKNASRPVHWVAAGMSQTGKAAHLV